MQTPLKLVTAPHPVLRQKTKKIETFDESLRHFLDQMMVTMNQEHGLGLAAPQVGKSYHAFTMQMNNGQPYKMCNLEILKSSDERIAYKEGCLSFPGTFLEIERPRDVLVRYMDEFGKVIEQEFTDWESRCIQHELDHLNGTLFIDTLSKDRQDFIIRKIKKGKADI